MLLSTPIVSRLYSVESLGLYHWVVSLSMFFSIVLNLQMGWSILKIKEKSKLMNSFYAISFCLLIFFACVCFVVSITFIFIRFDYYFWLFVLLLAFLIGFNANFSILFSRKGEIKLISAILIIKAFLISSLSVVFGFFDSYISLSVAMIVSEFTVFAISYKYSKFRFYTFIKARYIISKIFLNNIDNIKYLLTSQILSSASNVLILYTLKYFSVSSLGLYGMLFRVVSSPLYSVGNAIKAVLYIQILNVRRRTLLLGLMIFTMHILGLIFYFSYTKMNCKILLYILGDEWTGIDAYFPIFFLWVLSSVVNLIPAEVFKQTENQSCIFYAEIFSFIVKVFVVSFFYFYGNESDVLFYYPFCFYISNIFVLLFYSINLPIAVRFIDEN
jgi:O-antigen/teichoic acid export membrane protein